jgi:hypothetical protein
MRLYALMFCIASGLDLLLGVRSFGLVLHGNLIDPDSYMRLLRIEQGLQHGGLTNLVLRDDSGTPLVIEWSRLFDGMLVAMAAPLAPFLGWHRALFAAGLASGPLSAGLLGMGLGFAAAPFSENRLLWTAPVVAMLLPGIRGYAPFGVVHYHIIMLAATAFTAGFALRAREGGVGALMAAGLAGGIALWIMPETMPFVLFTCIGLGWRWLFVTSGAALAWLGAGFASVLALAILIDPPHGGIFVPEIDRVSIVYAALGAVVLAVTLVLAWLDRMGLTGRRRAALGLTAALVGFTFWLMRYPLVALGPYGLMSAREMHLFFGTMAETQPVRGVDEAFLLLAPGCFALAYCLLRAWRGRSGIQPAGFWLILASAILLSLILTARFVIFQQFPAGFAAALLPVALADASALFAIRPIRAASARVGLIGGILIIPYAPAMALAAAHPEAKARPACSIRAVMPLLAPLAGRIVLTTAAEVPELLYRTRVIAVGSLYQHGIGGFLRARAAWRSPVAVHPSAAMRKTGAGFVLFCPSTHRYAPVRGAPKDALWDALQAGHPPPWLRRVGAGEANGFQLYRITLAPGRPMPARLPPV